MTVTTRRDGNGGVDLTVVGELDLSTVDRFATALQSATDEVGPDGSLTLDLRGVEYLDSAAINALFAHAGQIKLVLVHPLLVRGLTISGLDRVVEVRPADPA